MTRENGILGAVVEPPSLQHVVERQAAGDPLRADPKRPGRQDVYLPAPEPCARAVVINFDRTTGVLQDLCCASVCPMLETGEGCDVGDAFA